MASTPTSRKLGYVEMLAKLEELAAYGDDVRTLLADLASQSRAVHRCVRSRSVRRRRPAPGRGALACAVVWRTAVAALRCELVAWRRMSFGAFHLRCNV